MSASPFSTVSVIHVVVGAGKNPAMSAVTPRATKNGAARRMTLCADFVAEVGDWKTAPDFG